MHQALAYYLADHADKISDWAQAASCLNKARTYDQENLELQFQLAQYMALSGEKKEAINILDSVIHKNQTYIAKVLLEPDFLVVIDEINDWLANYKIEIKKSIEEILKMHSVNEDYSFKMPSGSFGPSDQVYFNVCNVSVLEADDDVEVFRGSTPDEEGSLCTGKIFYPFMIRVQYKNKDMILQYKNKINKFQTEAVTEDLISLLKLRNDLMHLPYPKQIEGKVKLHAERHYDCYYPDTALITYPRWGIGANLL